MGDNEFLVCCRENDDGTLALYPVGGDIPDGAVSPGDKCVVVEVRRVNGVAVSAVVRNLSREVSQ